MRSDSTTERRLSIAVGIPTANNEETIRDTLESLIDQTVPPDRIIIVDASTDSTPAIVQEVDSETTVVIECHKQSDRGRGVGGARNDIHSLLEEDILACLDTQKRVGPEWIEKRLDFHYENPEYDVLSGMRSDSVVDRPASGPKDPNFLRQSNCSIRKSALDRVDGWDQWMGRGEDWDLLIRLWTSGAQSYIRSDLACEFVAEDDTATAFTKILGRPSSVDFLRKYGRWYVSFHPLHVGGDVASAVSLLLFPISVVLGVLWSTLAFALLSVPALCAGFYTYQKAFRGDADMTDIRPRHGVLAIRFFLLGYTSVRQLVVSRDHDWNMAGFDPEGPADD